ncbi:MAG: TraE/TraK family type IV conjugative transfer system protein [Thiothrix sp.]|uniref:TraE/TraK family type IV conjugative transfer system protein n=1 Tax=Thiothrix sp. TaxID=1032 RepID=UPI00260BE005|nr:TraE/TraK family type IV conjugative transfer system protein [Thiothrix sp.]MDD5395003.1 TraE/TraK family type IV conjugative transfer system protein [Thiothrix sp.]
MNRDKQMKDIGTALAGMRRWQWVAGILSVLVVLLVLTVFGKSTSTKTIFIPPSSATATKPYWVADSGASPEYYQMTADYVAQLALTSDPKSAAYNIDRLMSITHPSIQGLLKSELEASASKMRAENVTQAFYPLEYHTGDNRPVVAIKGTLKTWVGDKPTSSRQVLYRMEFSLDAGRIYLTGFKEAQPNDPLNEPKKPGGATP